MPSDTLGDMASEPSPAFLDTQPGPDHDWRITLKDKVIAITGANRGIGLAIAEVCLDDLVSVAARPFDAGQASSAEQDSTMLRFHVASSDVVSRQLCVPFMSDRKSQLAVAF